jgi:CDP-paratose 2-epimerase
MKLLITGGCGFLGSNLALEALRRNQELIVFDNLYRLGSKANLKWLQSKGKFDFVEGDIRRKEDIEKVIRKSKPEVIFHLAGQVAMTTSIQNPTFDFEVNALGTFNLLDAVRIYSPESVVCYSSTNKVYGDLDWIDIDESENRYSAPAFPNGFAENIPLSFASPYGCSKGAADQYMLDFYKTFGVKTVVFRHSSIYGGRQFATYDQGWIGWFCKQAVLIKHNKLKEPLTISGNGKQVRDVLYADDIVNLYYNTVDRADSIKGQVFNIGGGMNNSLSLLELFTVLEQELTIKISYKELPVRKSDQKIFVADITKAKSKLDWSPFIDKYEGIKKMLQWCEQYE